ncbi:unnamed protein product [Rotaria magnacalcarata]|uniref:Reverse transcriptase domain-containing protein n=2 Tax=Rotaria magnacalcarata TaxID=392030 RepID=A0A820FS36_9BILA|nr:unnamed protein product [Rotaria magnacalcarata]CAF2034303.1 unnamed protein product [Rotaria magnacalcarata]CAF4265555.1 unnamed protein product [Rotaria magnacalcarata]
MIVEANKGGKVVTLNKDDYFSKIEEKLNDTEMYEQVTNPINNNSISEFTEKLFKQNNIKQSLKLQLNSIDDLPRIRGQPKLHKVNHSMRLITCSRNTIQSSISTFAFSFIKELRTTIDNSMNNASEFVTKITKINMEEDENLASLDVQDMFTNIPLTSAVDLVINRIENSTTFNESTLSKTDLKKLLILSFSNNSTEFNKKIYKQKRNLPMGNCLSPILADLYLDDYISKHLSKVNREQKLFRYVGNILIITKMTHIELNKYVEELNQIKSNIGFTTEFEKNSKVNFLDTTLTKNTNDNKIDVR